MDGNFYNIFTNTINNINPIVDLTNINIDNLPDVQEINLIIEPQIEIPNIELKKNMVTKNYIKKNGEKIVKEYNSKKYNDKFREKIKNNPVICQICDSPINYYAMSNHKKSKKCMKAKALKLNQIVQAEN